MIFLAGLAAVAACSGDDTGSSATTIDLGLNAVECTKITIASVQPLQDFIDEYEDLTVEEWNELDPPPDVESLQAAIVDELQQAATDGCMPGVLDETLRIAIEGLEGEGEVGEAIAAALRGDPPVLGPPPPLQVPVTTVPRDAAPSVVAVEPGDDVAAILERVGEGSTLEFSSGVHEFDEPIVVRIDVEFVGTGRDETTIRSSAEGFAIGFVGPGGFSLRDMTVEHVGDAEASVLLASDGPVSIRDSVLSGGLAGDGETGAGHGIVFAFAPLEGFPEYTDEERSGPLLVENSIVTHNEAAGIIATGDAAPEISDSSITDNQGCGICYSDDAGGTVRNSIVQANQIGFQISGAASPTIEGTSITANVGVGVAIEGTSVASIVRSTVEENNQVGIQVSGESAPTIEDNTINVHDVGVLVTGSASPTIRGNTIARQEIGVQVGGSSQVDVVDNTIRASSVAAISYGGDSTGSVSTNIIESAAAIGIQAVGVAEITVEANRVEGAGEAGISFVDQSGGVASGNEVIGREVGIQVGGEATPTIENNTVRDSVAIGILYGDEAAGQATSNTITGSESVGVILSGSSSPTVRSNTITDNGVGVVAREEAAGSVTENSLLRHVIGMQIVDNASTSITNNTVSDSLEAGIAYGGNATGEFVTNTLVRNGNITVQVGEQAAPSIRNNEIRGQGVYGLLYRDSAAGVARDNFIVDHVFGIQLGDRAAPRLVNNLFREIALTSIVYGDRTGGLAEGNECPAEGLAAGITISPDADPTVAENPNCAVSRTDPDSATTTTSIPAVSTTVPAVSTTVPVGCPAVDGSEPQRRQFDAYPPMCIDSARTYTARVVTNLGALTINLDPVRAPLTVNSFVTLARYKYFDATQCHRAIPGFVVQCGDPTATGTGGPGYSFADELPEAGDYKIGSVAMANSGPNTNGSQFFLISGLDGAALPPKYSLFGMVTDGLATTLTILDAFGNPDNNGVPPLAEIRIESVTITES